LAFDLTPLHWAAQEGHLCVVEYLINHGADINDNSIDVEFLDLKGLPFIEHRKMVTLGLWNISLIKMLI